MIKLRLMIGHMNVYEGLSSTWVNIFFIFLEWNEYFYESEKQAEYQ